MHWESILLSMVQNDYFFTAYLDFKLDSLHFELTKNNKSEIMEIAPAVRWANGIFFLYKTRLSNSLNIPGVIVFFSTKDTFLLLLSTVFKSKFCFHFDKSFTIARACKAHLHLRLLRRIEHRFYCLSKWSCYCL